MTGAAPLADLTYAVDVDDCVVEVGDAWSSFALANGAPALTPEAVVGRSLWDFISDPETRYLYQVMFARVRRSDQPIVVPFRCDSPRLRRFLEMRIAPEDRGGLRLITRQLRTEEQEVPVEWQPPGASSGELITNCSWCKKVKVQAGVWIEVEEAVRRLGLFAAGLPPQLTHGICPACHADLHRQLRQD